MKMYKSIFLIRFVDRQGIWQQYIIQKFIYKLNEKTFQGVKTNYNAHTFE